MVCTEDFSKESKKQREWGCSERGHAWSGGDPNASCDDSLMGTTVFYRDRQS